MTQLNPLSGSILGSAQAQHQDDVEKTRQVRRAQTLQKNVALQDDQLEHQVESSEELSPIHDEDQRHEKQRRHSHPHKSNDDEKPHIDVKA